MVLVRVLWAPARREPDHRTEMVTQWLCGERVTVVEQGEGWIRARGQDGYVAWLPEAAVTPEPADDWLGTAAWSLGACIDRPHGRRAYLPWGARVRQPGEELLLPDGTTARALDPDVVVPAEGLVRRFPRDAGSIVATARSWIGVPYVWGGRTDTGCDCSGFVQAIYAVHGIMLPRDSRDQPEVGDRRPSAEISAGDLGEADLVFFAPERAGITHVAIATGGTRFIHCSSTRGAVSVDDLASESVLENLLRESVVCVTRPLSSSSASDPT